MYAAVPGRALDWRLTLLLRLPSSSPILSLFSARHGSQKAACPACRPFYALNLLYPLLPKVRSVLQTFGHGHDLDCRNREEVNDKTRERMRRLRAADKTVPPEVLAARLEVRRTTAKKYRERCGISVFPPESPRSDLALLPATNTNSK